MMSPIGVQGHIQTAPSFEEFCQNAESKVRQVVKERLIIQVNGLWKPLPNEISASITKCYTEEMEKIYGYVVQHLSIPVIDASLGYDVKIRLLLNLIFSLGDDQNLKSMSSRVIDYALTNEIPSDHIWVDHISVEDRKLNETISSIFSEIVIRGNAIESLKKYCTIIGKHGIDGIDLSSTYTKIVQGRQIVDLPLKPHVIQKIISYYFILEKKHDGVCDCTNFFHYMYKQPHLKQSLLDIGKFLARMGFPALRDYAYFWPLMDEQEKIDLMRIVVQSQLGFCSISSIFVTIRRIASGKRDLDDSVISPSLLEKIGLKLSKDDLQKMSVFMPTLSEELIKQATEAGNNSALRYLLKQNSKNEWSNKPSLAKGLEMVYNVLGGETGAQKDLRHQLMELGDLDTWKKSDPVLNNDKEIALKALALTTGDVSVIFQRLHSSLKEDQDVLTCFTNAIIKRGLLNEWKMLPPQMQTRENALEILSNTDDFSKYSDDFFKYISLHDFSDEIQNELKQDPRFHQLVEEKFRSGKYQYYLLLTEDKKNNRELIRAATLANPLVYWELFHQKNPCTSDPELVALFLKKCPWKTEYIMLKLHNPSWMFAAIRFAEFVLRQDEYLALGKDTDIDTKRYFNLAEKLSLDLQMVLAARSAGSTQTSIPTRDVEWALRFVLMLKKHEKKSELLC